MPIVTPENILQLLYSYNPWWRDGVLPKEYSRPTKRFAYNEAMKVLLHPDLKRFAILSGARRVGKTTMLYQLIEELLTTGVKPQNILYVSLDHPLLKFCSVEELLTIYETNVSSLETAYLFFDEIQYAADWELWLKIIFDSKPRYRLTATGSASPVIVQGASDSGVGRWTSIPVPTLSFYEYCELLAVTERPKLSPGVKPTNLFKMLLPQLSSLMNQLTPLQKHFHRYLTVVSLLAYNDGGFPSANSAGNLTTLNCCTDKSTANHTNQ